jgi:hypothetical protein
MSSSMDILSLPSPSWPLKGFEWSNRCGATKAAGFRPWTAEGGLFLHGSWRYLFTPAVLPAIRATPPRMDALLSRRCR